MGARTIFGVMGLTALLAACSPEADEDAASTSAEQQSDRTAVTVVTEPGALAYLDGHGYSFAERFAGAAAGAKGDVLATKPRYAALVDTVKRDVLAATATYPAHGYRLPAFGDATRTARERVGSSYQSLNWTWLASPALRWELVGVTNRFDRRIVPERAGDCGETRLLYRPAYDGPRESSRLPITVIVVFRPAGASEGCRAVASRWVYPQPTTPEGDAFGTWLAGGPLAGLASPISFELNVLVDLWARHVHEADGVGRHHQYALRVMKPVGDGLVEEPLANTPDIAQMTTAPRKAALLRWIKDNRSAIEGGRASLGPLAVEGEGNVDVRAKKVSAYTAMGLTRATNRPYSAVFGADLGAFKAGAGVASDGEAEALLRRLDTMTCNGCHVTRSVLGFHLVGEERDYALYRDHASHANDMDTQSTDADAPRNEPPFLARLVANKMAVGISPHLRDERDRRAADLLAYLKDGTAVTMPPPDRGKALAGTYGATCFLGDESHTGFGKRAAPEYGCKQGLHCVALDDSRFGQCIPKYTRNGQVDPAMRSVGDPFEVHDYTASADPFRERGPVTSRASCTGGGATGRDNGFPFGGICAPISDGRLLKDGATGCAVDGGRVPLGGSAYVAANGRVTLTPDRPEATRVVCGAAPYQDNVSRTWGKVSTAAMIWQSCAAGLQIACDEDNPCRDEYVCMRTLPDPTRPDPKKGTCMPGYVLAQLEIDAHKVPETRSPCLSSDGTSSVACP